MDFSAFATFITGSGGALALAVIFLSMFIAGRVVPRSALEKAHRDAGFWQEMAFLNAKTGSTAADTSSNAASLGRQVIELMERERHRHPMQDDA